MIAFAALAALLLPVGLWLIWLKQVKTVYNGTASVIDKFPSVSKGQWAVVLTIPGFKAELVYVPSDQARSIQPMVSTAVVQLKKGPFFPAWMEDLSWNGQTSDSASERMDGFLVGSVYALLGLAALLVSPKLGLDGSIWTPVLCAAAFCLSGLSANFFRFKRDQLQQGSMHLLGIPIGSGFLGTTIAVLVLGTLTALCFQKMSLLVLFPGIAIAFTFGGSLALLLKQLMRN